MIMIEKIREKRTSLPWWVIAEVTEAKRGTNSKLKILWSNGPTQPYGKKKWTDKLKSMNRKQKLHRFKQKRKKQMKIFLKIWTDL